MKRKISLICVVALILSIFAGCGSSSSKIVIGIPSTESETESEIATETKAKTETKSNETKQDNSSETTTVQADTKGKEAISTNRDDYSDIDITYEMLAREPNKYQGELIKFTGTITQIIPKEDGFYSFRMNVDDDYNQNLFVAYEDGTIDYNLLEDDSVTIYGMFADMYSYDTAIRGVITVPLVYARIIERNDESPNNSNITLELPQFPVTVNEYDWDDTVCGTYKIENVNYKFEKSYNGGYYLDLYFQGEKTYSTDNSFNWFSYKLYDSDGYIVDSGIVSLDNVNAGDKFKNANASVYNLNGENYRLEITDYK